MPHRSLKVDGKTNNVHPTASHTEDYGYAGTSLACAADGRRKAFTPTASSVAAKQKANDAKASAFDATQRAVAPSACVGVPMAEYRARNGVAFGCSANASLALEDTIAVSREAFALGAEAFASTASAVYPMAYVTRTAAYRSGCMPYIISTAKPWSVHYRTVQRFFNYHARFKTGSTRTGAGDAAGQPIFWSGTA